MQKRVAETMALLIVATVVGVTIRSNSFIPWGTDSGAYLTAAQGWLNADLFRPAELSMRFPWASDGITEAPYGHRPGPTKGSFTSFYPLGYPLLLATALGLGGPLAPHVVAPLSAGLLAWCAFLLGRQLSTAWAGVIAAALIAATPVTIAHVVIPMSDVPATALWALSWVLSLRPGLGGVTSAGLTAALAMMVRPNLAPLAIVISACAAAAEGRDLATAVRRVLVFGATAAAGPALVMWSQAALYGGPFNSGYPASMDYFFNVERIPANARTYPLLLVQLHTWLPFTGLAFIFVAARRARLDPRHRRAALIAFSALALAAVNYALYLAYLSFQDWQSLRFVLPGMLALFLLFAAAIDELRLWLAARNRWVSGIAVFPVVVTLLAPRVDIQTTIREAPSHRRLLLMGRYLREALPANAVILTHVHGGALSLYTGKPIVRLDHIADDALDRVVSDLTKGGYRPVFAFDLAVEHAQLVERFATSRLVRLDWHPRAEFATTLGVAYHDARDRDSFASGDRWPFDVLQTEPTFAPWPPWPIRRMPLERIVFPSLAESWAFKTALEATYRGVLRRPDAASRVSSRTSVLWLRRYLRLRLHGCSHVTATDELLRQIDGGEPAPLCARPSRVVFPARNETVDFRRQLDAHGVADDARTPRSFVDLEGDAVWVQDYLQLRAAGCSHERATQAVIQEVSGQPSDRECARR